MLFFVQKILHVLTTNNRKGIIWNNYLFVTQWPKKRNSLFWSLCQNQIFVFGHDDKKGNFFFLGHVVKNKYLFWENDQKRDFLFLGNCTINKYLFFQNYKKNEIPFFGHLLKTNICFCMSLSIIFPFFFLAFAFFHNVLRCPL